MAVEQKFVGGLGLQLGAVPLRPGRHFALRAALIGPVLMGAILLTGCSKAPDGVANGDGSAPPSASSGSAADTAHALSEAGTASMAGAPVPAAGARDPASGLPLAPIAFTGAKGSYRIVAEVASTPAEQEKGLMNRKSLSADAGMIFPYTPAQEVSFWMKNTEIPLDIVFVTPDRKIGRIAAQTTPYSLDPIASLGPVSAVIEIPGGRAAQLGLAPGDKVSW